MFTWRARAVAVGVVVAALFGSAPASGAVAATGVGPAAASPRAYPQTKPSAGQFCKRIHRGRVTRAANGRMVRCTAEGSRSRWRYTR